MFKCISGACHTANTCHLAHSYFQLGILGMLQLYPERACGSALTTYKSRNCIPDFGKGGGRPFECISASQRVITGWLALPERADDVAIPIKGLQLPELTTTDGGYQVPQVPPSARDHRCRSAPEGIPSTS